MKATRDLIGGLSLLMLSALPASSENIQLEQLHGIYMVPVRINDTVTVPFVLDSGASEVSIPEDVFSVLRRARTISQSDFIGTGTYTLAGGATVSSERYILHRVTVGNHVITDVVANVASVKGDPLLGQSFLSKLPGWSVDNAQHVLVLHDEAGSRGLPQSGERPTSGPSPETASHAVPMPPPPLSPPPPSSANADVVSSGASAYENGDYPTAMTTLLPAAQTGDPTAQYYVGLMYLKGQGILKNTEIALSWLNKSATSGNAYAQTYMGAFNRRGEITPRNYDAAVRWYLLAAKQNFKNSQYSIARMYYNGQGVPKDMVMAYMWAVIASSEGEPTFSQFRLRLEQSLSGAEMAEGRRKAASWRTSN